MSMKKFIIKTLLVKIIFGAPGDINITLSHQVRCGLMQQSNTV